MPDSTPVGLQLNREFYERPTLQVARDLLGMRLVRLDQGRRLSGIIVEAEAYRGEEDQGCHCRAGLTPRTRVMYGPAGHAYVYFTYGMHWMLNFVTEPAGFPAAVLIRSVMMEEGLELVSTRRNGQPPQHWTDGPAKLCQALNIDQRLNGADLCDPEAELFVTTGHQFPDSAVSIGPRVGLTTVPEPWKSVPWRFVIKSTANLELT